MESLATQVKKTLGKMSRPGEIRRILLIDKEPNSRLASQLALDGRYRVHCASVQDAWNFVYPYPPHVIVLHVYTAGTAALADFQECRALAGGVPIVLAISAAATQDFIRSARHGSTLVLAAAPSASKDSSPVMTEIAAAPADHH
jgi:DNA-binding NtrC family response regulator